MAKKPRKKSPKKPAKAQATTVSFTRGAKLSEPTDESWSPHELAADFPEITDVKKRLFLAAITQVPRIGLACKMAGITPKTSWHWRHDADDPLFLEAYQRAYMIGLERAESELWRRGIQGVEEPVYHQGQLVGSKKVFSDTLLIFGLKGGMREKYADHQRMAGPGGGPVQMDHALGYAGLSDEEFLSRLERARQNLLAGSVGPDLPGQVVATPDPETEALRAYERALEGRGNGKHGGNGNG
jgi:hypothetical protein